MNDISLKHEDLNYLVIRLFEINKNIQEMPFFEMFNLLKHEMSPDLEFSEED